MDRDTLFKQLAKHYNLDPNKDWWQHRQSGNWVLSHSAVQKLASTPTPEGHVVVTPGKDTIDWIKTGNVQEGGVHGPEVVIGGEFLLMDKMRVVRRIYAIGEANGANVNKSVPYSFAMAWKRMFDRGVLEVLAFSQLNLYSSVEADTFMDPAQIVRTSAPEPVEKVQPAPQISPPKAEAKRPAPPMIKPPAPKQAEKKTTVVQQPKPMESLKDAILSCLNGKDGEHLSKGDICKATGIDPKRFLGHMSALLDSGAVMKVGEKKGTRYYKSTPVDSSPDIIAAPPLDVPEFSMAHFKDLWSSTTKELESFGVPYTKLSEFTYKVTGHRRAIDAYNSGSLSISRIEDIFVLGKDWAAANVAAVPL